MVLVLDLMLVLVLDLVVAANFDRHLTQCQKMTSLRGQTSSAKMTSLGGKGLFTRPISEHDFTVS